MDCCHSDPDVLTPGKHIQKHTLTWGSIILLAVVGAWFFISRNSSTQSLDLPPLSSQGETRSDNGDGNVTVVATAKESGNELIFNLQLDTHSVNFDDFDPARQIVLASQDGSAQAPKAVSSSGSGHHREFTLSFAKTERPFRLVITDLAGVSARELVWE